MTLEYFPCYHSYLNKLRKLSDQEVGRLFRALLTYSATGEPQELAGRESMAYDFIADDIDRAKANYQKKSEQNRANRLSSNDNKRERPSTDDNDSSQSNTKSKDETEDKNETEDESELSNTQECASFDPIDPVAGAAVLSTWNALGLQQIAEIRRGTVRYKNLAERIQAHGAEGVLRAWDEIKKSDYLMGSNGGKPVRFDWAIKKETFCKILAGYYRNNTPPRETAATSKIDPARLDALRKREEEKCE